MHDVPGQEEGLVALRQAIGQRWPIATEVPGDALEKRFPARRLVAGWRIPGLLPGEPHDLLVAVDQEFPWSLPLVALPEATKAISYPHVEVDGHLCLTPSESAFVLPVGIEHVVQLLSDACDVLAQGCSGANDDDFYAEGQSYWSLVQPSRGSIWLVSPPPEEHALWVSAVTGDSFVVGPKKQALQDWADAGRRRLLGGFEPALVVRLDAPLHPKEYPLTMKDLTSFIKQQGAGAQLQAAVARWHARRELPVVLVFPHGGKTVCLGATFLAPCQVRLPGARHSGLPGFRSGAKGRKGAARLVALGMVPGRFPHLRVTPVYRAFLHERTAGAAAVPLAACHVIVAGCGAIGGQLAVQLVQAGVGRLTLLDGDVLTWQNVGRHVVDSSAVGQSKAKALEQAIRIRFPDAQVEGIPKTWQAYRRDDGAAFNEADLMIAATGDAAGNLHLDSLSANGEVPATIFTWIEPFGVAAHALLRVGDRGLRDVTDAMGRLSEPVADLTSAPLLPREPACGAFYQPYSSLSSLPCVALAGQLALDALNGRVSRAVHRVWVGGPDEFGDNGLSLHAAWLTRLNSHGYHRRYEFIV
jgi:hypothetical protein